MIERPSPSVVWPPQKMLSPYGTETKVPLFGFQRRWELIELSHASNVSTWPVGIRTMWTDVSGQLSTGPHWPVAAGPPVFWTVTVTVVAVAVFPAWSRATAVSVCEPLPTPVVSQFTPYGADVSSEP